MIKTVVTVNRVGKRNVKHVLTTQISTNVSRIVAAAIEIHACCQEAGTKNL